MDASSRPRAEPQPPSSAPSSSTSDDRDGRVLASDPFPAEPSGRAVHGPAPSTPRVTAIGDSVMVGAAPALEQALAAVQIDASVGRQVSSAIDVVRAMRNADELGQVVVIDMGNNGTFANSQFDSLMQLLTGVPRVVFVNVTVPREWEETNNDVILRGVDRYPNAVLVNWHG